MVLVFRGFIYTSICIFIDISDPIGGDGVNQATLGQMASVFMLMIIILAIGFLVILCECCSAANKDKKTTTRQKVYMSIYPDF